MQVFVLKRANGVWEAPSTIAVYANEADAIHDRNILEPRVRPEGDEDLYDYSVSPLEVVGEAQQMTVEEAHAYIFQAITDLQVTSYYGDDDHARSFRVAQADRLLTDDPRAKAAIYIIRRAASE